VSPHAEWDLRKSHGVAAQEELNARHPITGNAFWPGGCAILSLKENETLLQLLPHKMSHIPFVFVANVFDKIAFGIQT
jgi:hypothetical protein